MSNKVLLQNGSGAITPVCMGDAAVSTCGETARRDTLHEQLSRLAWAFEAPVDEERDDDRREIDHTARHAFAASHVHAHSDDVGRMHSPVRSWTAAPAEAASGPRPHVALLSGSARPGPKADISFETRQQGDNETGKLPPRIASPATRDTLHDVSRNTMLGAKPPHGVHDAVSVPSWIAAPAEAASAPHVALLSGSAHPGAQADISFEPRQQGGSETGKSPPRTTSSATRKTLHDVSRNTMLGAQPPHGMHDDVSLSRPICDGYSRGRNASAMRGVVAARATAPYEASFATYCWAMNGAAVAPRAIDEANDRFDYALIDDQAHEAVADASVEEVGAQCHRIGRKPRGGPLRISQQPAGSSEDRVQSVAGSAVLRMRGSAAAPAPSVRTAPARMWAVADSVTMSGEVTPWRLHYTFRSWHGAPSIELTQAPASFDMRGRAGRLIVAVTASNIQSGASARQEIARALARGDAPTELADATMIPVRAVSA